MESFTAAQVVAAIEEIAPLHYQEPYDNAGFCVGNPQKKVTAALLCVDVTEAVLHEALEIGADIIISHHPVIFKGLKHITGSTYVERIIENAIKYNLTLYSAHTNVDSIRGGVSEAMAVKLQLQQIRILAPRSACNETGFGITGYLPKPLSSTIFLQQLKNIFGTPVIRHSQQLMEKISQVAVCGGSGGFLLQTAITEGAQVFVSADFKYHDFFDADKRLMIADVGHYESEREVVNIFYSCLTKKIPTFVVYLTKHNTNAINYF